MEKLSRVGFPKWTFLFCIYHFIYKTPFCRYGVGRLVHAEKSTPACSLVCWTNFALKMEAIRSSETSGATQRTALRHIPEDDTLHNHRCENLKYYNSFCCSRWLLSLKSLGSWTHTHVAFVIFWTRFVTMVIMIINSLPSCSESSSCGGSKLALTQTHAWKTKINNFSKFISPKGHIFLVLAIFSTMRHSRETGRDK
jgi:hypothetical protein